jgi:hypothetical protein
MARQQRTDTVEVAHSPRRIPFSVPSHTGQTSCPTESIAGHTPLGGEIMVNPHSWPVRIGLAAPTL